MTNRWKPAPGIHAVQFYENKSLLHDSVVRFFAAAMTGGEPSMIVARPDTFETVATRLASDYGASAAEVASRIRFLDVDAALGQVMTGTALDLSRLEQGFSSWLANIRRLHGERTIWIYGEMVDVLCERGNHADAIRIEELWNTRFFGPQVSVLCGYAARAFDNDAGASHLRSVCRQHTHVMPSEHAVYAGALAERVGSWRARGPQEQLGNTVYIVEDDDSVRRAFERLLRLHDLRVRSFASAEAFLTAVPRSSRGCVIADLDLPGMSGVALQQWMAAGGWSMPVVAISGSQNRLLEIEARRLGAVAFLRKPFDTRAMLQAVSTALSLRRH